MKKDTFENIYEPQEDSKLLLKHSIQQIEILNKTNLNICEVGVGSGFVISNIAEKLKNKNTYYATDINPDAIKYTKLEFEKIKQKINLTQTNLLDNINNKDSTKTKFDIILFNTPYLPCEDGEKYENLTLKDKAIYGGKHGYEVIEQFIIKVNENLKDDNSFVIIVFSSQSNLEYIEKVLNTNLFKYEILEQENVFFEKLIALKFYKSKLLKEFESKNISNIKYLASGKHSTVYEGIYEKNPVIIKIGKEQHLTKEAIFTKKFQSEDFMPKFYFESQNYIVREKLEGLQIKDFLETSKKKETIEVLDKSLQICQRLDELKINKFEMTNPYKHIFIDKDLNVKFIDFERCIYTTSPKNTTQFFQYLKMISPQLKEKKIEIDAQKIMDLSQIYKKDNFKITIKDIIN